MKVTGKRSHHAAADEFIAGSYFGPIVCFDFTHDRAPIAVRLAQHCRCVVVLWLMRPPVEAKQWADEPMLDCSFETLRAEEAGSRAADGRERAARSYANESLRL